METTLTRLKDYIENKGLNVAEFERTAGWGNGSLAAQIKKGGTVGVNKIESTLKIFPELNIEWLFTGLGSKEKTATSYELHEPSELNLKSWEKRHDTQLIPLFDMTAAAGMVKLFDGHNNIIDYISIPNMPKCDGAIAIMGDSMYPLVKSGDLVFFKTTEDIPDSIIWGQMYLISLKIDGEYLKMVKFVQKSDLGDEFIKLVSQNSHHAPKDVKLQNIGAMGLIKGMFRYTLS